MVAFNEELLLQKKARFLAAVEQAARPLGVHLTVNFWDCPEMKTTATAHIHIHTATICISEKRLTELTFDLIREVAVHEVNHLTDTCDECNDRHSPGFYQRHIELMAATWRPPGGGIVFIKEGKSDIAKTDPKAYEPDPSQCHYHQCKKKGKTNECIYCGQYYCEEHVKPGQPSIGANWGDSPAARLARLESNSSHPCVPYAKYKEQQDNKAKELYVKALEEITKRKSSENVRHEQIEQKVSREKKAIERTPQKFREQSGNIRVQLQAKNHSDLSDVEIILSQNEIYVKSVRTNKKGHAVFDKVPTGKYRIVAIKGQTFKDKEINVISGKTTAETINIPGTLKQTIKETEPPQKEEEETQGIAPENDDGVKEITKRKSNNKKKLFLIGGIVAIILLGFLIYQMVTEAHSTSVNETNNMTSINLSQPVPSLTKIDFSEYLTNTDKYVGQTIILQGRLVDVLEGTKTSGKYVQFIIDDNDNRIELTKLNSVQLSIFSDTKSASIYEVTGILKRTYARTYIEASNITQLN